LLVLRRNVVRFVILFPGRTGSTFLVSALDAHPDIEAKGEVLDGLRSKGVDVQRAWLDRYFRTPFVGRHRAVGFKTKLRDVFDQEHFAAAIERYDALVIVLDRRNDVKHAVSRITARVLRERTGRWNRYEGSDELGLIEVDPDDFAERLTAVEDEKRVIRDFADSLGRPYLDLDYEDLLADPDATFGRVFDLLGVRRVPVQGATFKNTSDDLGEVIANFADLRSRYVGTPYEAMFDEGR
jgi:LPS sulfotransferase NodH